MSEAREIDLPVQPPVAGPRKEIKRGINIRKAMAGIYLLQGQGSVKTCLQLAGYAKDTSRGPKQRGLSAEECIAEAQLLEPEKSPARMLSVARERMTQAWHAADPLRTPFKDLTRAWEATEKLFGAHERPAIPGLEVVDRIAKIQELIALAQLRGIPVGRTVALETKDAVVVGESRSTCDSEEKSIGLPPMSDNGSYVNSGKSIDKAR